MLAFYRKYRPQTFKEVLGQENIVSALSGAIEQGKVFHAYLFTGSRGTGKTSIARIFAKAIGTSDKDIYELDAASNTSVDDIREIVEGSRTLPFESEKKVYIIDEVHMLSKSAFNAFLKTLEEPPKHVVFILATTETHKLPATVISRCQNFSFKKPSEEIIKKQLGRVAKGEGLEVDKSALELIATLGDGSFRDAIGILDQVSGMAKDKKVTIEDVESLTGAPRGEVVHGIIKAILDKDISGALTLLHKAKSVNADMKVFTKLLLRDLRTILLLKFAPDMEKGLSEDMSETEAKLFKEFKAHPNIVSLPEALREFIVVSEEVSRSSIPEMPIELALIRLLTK